MSDWLRCIQELAAERISDIERGLRENAEDYPDYATCSARLDVLEEQRVQHREALLDALADAWLQYCGALTREAYLAGARDGGRLYHAFITGELPTIQKRKDDPNDGKSDTEA